MKYSQLLLYRGIFLEGMATTVRLNSFAFLIGIFIALLLFSGRTSRIRGFRLICVAIVEAGKGIPALVIMFWLYLCLPLITNLRLSAETAAISALALNFGVNTSEVFRSSWSAAARDLRNGLILYGLPRSTSISFFAAPFLFSAAMPGILAQLASTIKLSAICAFIGVPEIFHATQSAIQQTYQPVTLYSALAIFYLVIIFSITIIESALRRRQGNDTE